MSPGLVYMLINAFLSKKYPYIFPETPSTAIHVSSESVPSDYPITLLPESPSVAIHVSSEPVLSDYPITLPARAFKSTEVMNLPCVSVQKTELMEYQHRPELLQRETFVSFNEDQDEYGFFRIPMFITPGQERTFYVVYADEGPEAVAFTSIDLFDLLRTSKRVRN